MFELFCLLVFTFIYGGSSKPSSFVMWENSFTGNLTVDSYLTRSRSPTADNVGWQTVKDVMEVIHRKQHIGSEECKQRRLLVLQMSSTSFEGTGSILKQVMLGVAIAMHSNRTLVWGLGHPFLFEHSKERWAGPEHQHLRINDHTLNCSQLDPGAGPFGCFFEPVSTCSLGDVAPAELVEFSKNAFNESARVMLAEIRKGVALYHPPHGILDYIAKKRKYSKAEKESIKQRQHHLWAAAVAAYSFRLKPSVEAAFERRRLELFRSYTSASDQHQHQQQQQRSPQEVDASMPLQREQLHTVRQGAAESNTSCWGLHVRHGDLKALSTVYSYKEIFEFEDYFTVARSLSNVLQESPQCIFVSTDSVEADDLQSIFDRFNEREVKQLQAPAQKKEKKSSTGSSPRYARQYRRSVSASDTEYSDYSTDDVDEEHHGVVEGVVETSSQPLWKATDKSKKMSAAQGFDRGTIHSARSDAAAPFASNGFAHDDDNERDAADDDDDYDEDDDDDSDWEAFNNNKVNSDLVDSLLHSSGGNRNSWYEHRIPAVHTINNVDRYRTKHGSHTVAANGGCLRDPNYDKRGMRCALNYEDIVLYQGIEEHRSVPRSLRLMRVLLESIEDLYLLSRCERLVAQGSSHFSTLAALLIWARTGVRQIENVNVYLDAPSIAAGFTPTAYLHGMNLLNGTHGVDTTNPAAGRQRWQMHTFSFISGLKTDLIDNTQLYPDGAFLAPQNWMQLVEGLPRLPEKIFYWEARSWLGRGKRGQQHTYEPSWPGHCPADMPRGHDPTMFAGAVVNLGVDHLGASHTGQALQCWQVALQALETIPKKKWDKKIQNIAEVARENAKTQWIMRYAEMVINENRNPAEYLSYSAKYMQKTFDGVSSFGQTAGGYAAGGGGGGLIEQLPLGDSFSGGMDNGRMSLDDLQEEINRLEAHLAKLKELRDRMLDVSRQYASVRHQ